MSPAESYGLLAAAILSEIAATASLKAADGMTRIAPLVIVFVGYGLSFWLLSVSLERFPIAFVYSVWAGFGMIGTAVCGWLLFGESLAPSAIAGIALTVLGTCILARAMGMAGA